MQCALYYTADFGNAVDHPDIPSTQKIRILHTRAIKGEQLEKGDQLKTFQTTFTPVF